MATSPIALAYLRLAFSSSIPKEIASANMLTLEEIHALIEIRNKINLLLAKSASLSDKDGLGWREKGMEIIALTATQWGLLQQELLSYKRTPRLIWPRYMAVNLCKAFIKPTPSLSELAILFQKTEGWIVMALDLETKQPMPKEWHTRYDALAKQLLKIT